MKGESQILNDSFLTLFYEPVENTIFNISSIENFKRVVAHSDLMKKEVINILGLQAFQGFSKHFL